MESGRIYANRTIGGGVYMSKRKHVDKISAQAANLTPFLPGRYIDARFPR